MFLIRFADMPQAPHVSAVWNLQMSARRGADSQDSPATRHPKADVLSRPSVPHERLLRASILRVLYFVGIKRTAFPQGFLWLNRNRHWPRCSARAIPSFF